MEANTNTATSLHPVVSVANLSDAELLAGTRRLVGRSNQLVAELLAHLSEVEARGIHRTRACSSLYTYCMYELRFSEDEAFRRVAAARLARRFPALLDAVASGELHLTGLLMLGPHLTEQNLVEVLARAKHRTKRELGRLVRVLDPLPGVPARIEPLGPAPARALPATPTWEEFVGSMCPVRELVPGDRPRDWTEAARIEPHQALAGSARGEPGSNDVDPSSEEKGDGHAASSAELSAPARVEATPFETLGPERYKVQFTVTSEYVRLVEEAKALLSHNVPRVTLDELHLRALRALVSELTKKKYATKKPSAAAPTEHDETGRDESAAAPAQPAAPKHPRQRGRHIPAAVRRAVFERDGNRCSYVNTAGTRCAETHLLEFHHLEPFAAGGEHTESNLTLRCAAHNALAADEDFGRDLMEKKRSRVHEPFGGELAASELRRTD